ncbi:MAG: hypothetical protein R3C49_11145 [Planctomycetaceae bacterium]
MTDVDDDGFVEYGDLFAETPYLYVVHEAGRFSAADLAVYPKDDSRNMLSVYELPEISRPFQIISAGPDGRFGCGGSLPPDNCLQGERTAERDNITNFSNGRLEDR